MASVALRSSRSFSYPTASESSALACPLRVGEADPTGAPKPRLLDRVRAAIRARHYSRRTEKTYVAWIRRYIFFHDKRHPADMGAPEVTRFLSSLAVEGKVAASTQNQALSALLFLYREVLAVDLPWMDEIVRAKRPQRLPVVLTRDEVRAVLRTGCWMRDIPAVPTRISDALYGGALRDSIAGRRGRRNGKSPELLDCRNANRKARPMLRAASPQRLGRYAGQCIHGPNSSGRHTRAPTLNP